MSIFSRTPSFLAQSFVMASLLSMGYVKTVPACFGIELRSTTDEVEKFSKNIKFIGTTLEAQQKILKNQKGVDNAQKIKELGETMQEWNGFVKQMTPYLKGKQKVVLDLTDLKLAILTVGLTIGTAPDPLATLKLSLPLWKETFANAIKPRESVSVPPSAMPVTTLPVQPPLSTVGP